MPYHTENTQFDSAMELFIEKGFSEIADAVSKLMNTALKIEQPATPQESSKDSPS